MSSGNYHRGGSNHREDPALLKGLLASDLDDAVYPEDRCAQCEREGRDADECFRLHWSGSSA